MFDQWARNLLALVATHVALYEAHFLKSCASMSLSVYILYNSSLNTLLVLCTYSVLEVKRGHKQLNIRGVRKTEGERMERINTSVGSPRDDQSWTLRRFVRSGIPD